MNTNYFGTEYNYKVPVCARSRLFRHNRCRPGRQRRVRSRNPPAQNLANRDSTVHA